MKTGFPVSLLLEIVRQGGGGGGNLFEEGACLTFWPRWVLIRGRGAYESVGAYLRKLSGLPVLSVW